MSEITMTCVSFGQGKLLLATVCSAAVFFAGSWAQAHSLNIPVLPGGEIVVQESGPSGKLLRQKSLAVDPRAPELDSLLENMRRAVQQNHAGGLAAVQLGVPVRAVVLRLNHGEFASFLNPVLLHQSRYRVLSWERCLSVPWGYRLTERPAKITVGYQTQTGAKQRKILQGDEAVVFQQELDHLDGKLLSDGYAQAWFVPEAEMPAFMANLSEQCRGLAESACKRMTRQRWLQAASRRLNR